MAFKHNVWLTLCFSFLMFLLVVLITIPVAVALTLWIERLVAVLP